MDVLLIGGTGLISTGIVRLLRERGAGVTMLHRSAGGEQGADSVLGDRNHRGDLERALDAGPYDAVVDMVCFRPDQAELAADVFAGRVAQYVFCSTVDVYRKTVDHYPLTEDAVRDPSPTFPYAFAKAACERVFEEAAGRGAFALTILRPAATYLDGAVAPFGSYQLNVERLRAGRPIVLPGDGTSIWTAAHRDDVALAFANALGNAAALGSAYHLAGAELLTWNSYWTIVAEALGVEPRFVHIPTDVLRRLAPRRAEWCAENFRYDNIFDTGAAARDLGFAATIGWREGVSRFPFAFPDVVPADLEHDVDAVLADWEAAIMALPPVPADSTR